MSAFAGVVAALALASADGGALPPHSEPGLARALGQAAASARAAHQSFTAFQVGAPTLIAPTREAAVETLGLRLPPRPERCWEAGHPCWVAIYLPGFDSTVADVGARLTLSFDAAEAAGAPPMIAVTLDPRTRLGGGFYVDSAAAGAWETFAVKELLPAVSALVPGIPPSHVLLVGHSMGGFGALLLGLRHPELFSRVGALSPVIRPAAMADELLPTIERSHGAEPLDPAPLLRAPTTAHFPERLLWADLAALGPPSARPGSWAAEVATAEHPWRLTAPAEAALGAFDLVKLARANPGALKQLTALYLSDGTRDRLIPTSDVRDFAEAASASASSADRVHLAIHGGDHVDHLPAELEHALIDLTRP